MWCLVDALDEGGTLQMDLSGSGFVFRGLVYAVLSPCNALRFGS